MLAHCGSQANFLNKLRPGDTSFTRAPCSRWCHWRGQMYAVNKGADLVTYMELKAGIASAVGRPHHGQKHESRSTNTLSPSPRQERMKEHRTQMVPAGCRKRTERCFVSTSTRQSLAVSDLGVIMRPMLLRPRIWNLRTSLIHMNDDTEYLSLIQPQCGFRSVCMKQPQVTRLALELFVPLQKLYTRKSLEIPCESFQSPSSDGRFLLGGTSPMTEWGCYRQLMMSGSLSDWFDLTQRWHSARSLGTGHTGLFRIHERFCNDKFQIPH